MAAVGANGEGMVLEDGGEMGFEDNAIWDMMG